MSINIGDTTQNLVTEAVEDLGSGDVLDQIYNLDRTADRSQVQKSNRQIRIRTTEFTSRIS
jgi:hypothetical protein